MRRMPFQVIGAFPVLDQIMPRTVPPTICVVDDDDELLSAIKFAMEIDGFHVNTYGDAMALLLNQGRARCQCLVVDYRLPQLDGLDLIKRLKARGVAAPAILTTSNPSAALRARAQTIGVAIVEKPLLRNDLTEAVRRAIAEI
jgi:FixJ family two-component response regulator